MSINISVAQLRRKSIIDSIQAVLKETNLSPQLLDLEVTESIFIESFDEALETLKQLRAIGVGVSLDDFGTGYSSLSHLQHLPIVNLKMDQVFIEQDRAKKAKGDIAQSIIDLAHKLKLKVIAEGVETQGQAKLLKNIECDFYQGYLLSRPMPASQVIDFLTSHQKTLH